MECSVQSWLQLPSFFELDDPPPYMLCQSSQNSTLTVNNGKAFRTHQKTCPDPVFPKKKIMIEFHRLKIQNNIID